ncbi:MAG TPA: hypothetical protein VGN69_00195 [Solirubrobacteraceae bacterium]|jgi:hypothetical protein|nr:hypothetical protein [Solirubrobacteraceae bacterium]
MARDAEIAPLGQIEQRTGAQVTATEDELTVSFGELVATVPLPPDDRPDVADGWALLDFRRALPGRGRGDQREMLISAIVQDAAPGHTRLQSAALDDALADRSQALFAAREVWQRDEIAAVLRDQYFVTPSKSARSRPFLFPFQSALPVNYRQRGQYKMFRSDILMLLCWDGTDIDPEPVRGICELLNDRESLTLLDGVMVDAALRFAGDGAVEEISAENLLGSDQADKVRRDLAGGPAFAQGCLDRFREDIVVALDLELPRHDKVAAVIHTLALHLALYYYEISARLGQGIDAITRAAAGMEAAAGGGIAGRLRFRVGTAGDRPVSGDHGCVTAWRELDDGYLIAYSPNLICCNLLHRVSRSANPGITDAVDPEALASAMRGNPELASLIDASASALAVLYSSRAAGASPDALAGTAKMEPGPYALRSAVLGHRRKTLKHLSRDVVNQLVRRPFGGSLIRTRGRYNFFELDEEFLFLLVKFVLVRARRDEVQFSQFLSGLALYGLVPQDAAERETLASALERLGMLSRYSDAGEATYVRHPL